MVKKQALKKVSIIVPVFNAELYLGACIDSILNQNYGNIEILIVDDGSTDQSEDICRKYLEIDDRIKYIYQQNTGASTARNRGVVEATGDYITFVDADDLLQLDAIHIMVTAMQDTGADCVRTKCNVHNKGDVTVLSESIDEGVYEGSDIQQLMYAASTGNLMSYSWLLMIKRAVLINSKLVFPTGILMMEDMWFFIDLLKSVKTVVVSNKVTYDYFVRDGGATRSSNDFDNKLGSIAAVNEHIVEQKFDEKQRAHINAVNAGNMVNFTIINSVRMKKISSMYALLDKICSHEDFHNMYENADTTRLSIYYKIACWAAYKNNKMILILIVMTRKVSGR